MSVEFLSSGDIFRVSAQAIVNPVNCVGVMGAGLALAFKERHPENFAHYARACRQKNIIPGGLLTFDLGVDCQEPYRWICNLATKNHWREPSQIQWVESGAVALQIWAQQQGVTSISCPALGAGLGQLPWHDVQAVLKNVFHNSSVDLLVFEPQQAKPKASSSTNQRR